MFNNNIHISLVTPSYNQGEYIGDAIDSVITQRCDGFSLQYLVQDNCSTDSTPMILAQYEDQILPRIHVSPDCGQADALNKGFASTDGEILGWLNSDDVLLPGALETVALTFKTNPDIDVVYGQAYFIDKTGLIQGKYPTTDFNGDLLLSTCYLSQPSVFFRRPLFESVGGLDNRLSYCLDYNLWLKFYLAGAAFYYLKQPLSATRVYETTKTASGGKQFADEVLEMLEGELGHVPAVWQLYYQYSQKKNFSSGYKLSSFLTSTPGFLLNNPSAISDVYSWVRHIGNNKLANLMSRLSSVTGAHYSSIS